MQHSVDLKTDVTVTYLDKAFDFALRYHLSPTKMKRDRTTGKHRHLGGIVDAFVTGKVIELGVLDILKKIDSSKEYLPDLDVRDEQDFSEPDITKIKDTQNPGGRPPKAFVEIKNDVENYGWAGLYKEQYESMLSNPIVSGTPEKIFIVYARIVSKNSFGKEQNDLFGAYLKSKQFDSRFNIFPEPTDFFVEVQFVMTGKELNDSGEDFNKKDKNAGTEADFMFDPKMIEHRQRDIFNAGGTLGKNFVKETVVGNILPIQNMKNYPRQLGNFTATSGLEVFSNTRFKSSLYLKCKSSANVENHLVGKFVLEKGVNRLFVKITQECNRNNILVAKRNLNLVLSKTPIDRMKEIAKNI